MKGAWAAALTLSAVLASPLGRTHDTGAALRRAVRSANRLVRSVSRREPGYSDLATTLDVIAVTVDGDGPSLHFAHVGNASLWLQRASAAPVELLTESHAIDGGPLLRAVGLSAAVLPDVGNVTVEAGDRIFLTTASPFFAFTPEIMNAVAGAQAGCPIPDCVATLADAVRAASAEEGVTIVAGEVARAASFLAWPA